MKIKHRPMYKCKKCGLVYYDEKWARKCEKWCRKHDSCNVSVIRHAVTHRFLE